MENQKDTKKYKLLFEPWALGDLIIAVSVFQKLKDFSLLAYHSKWRAILRLILENTPENRLIPLELPYTTRDKNSVWDIGDSIRIKRSDVSRVLNIRGDIRDWYSAKCLFQGARITMSGWIAFIARRSRLVNLPYRLGLMPVRNRYRAWCELTNVSFDELTVDFRDRTRLSPINKKILIHMGAQWKSKQFPHVSELATKLTERGFSVNLVCGHSDSLPEGIEEKSVLRIQDEALIGEIKSSEFIITNDSGPMHLAALLGGRTLALVRVSDFAEWSPPGVHFLGPNMPKGYRPHPKYSSDEILLGWSEPGAITEYICNCHLDIVAKGSEQPRS